MYERKGKNMPREYDKETQFGLGRWEQASLRTEFKWRAEDWRSLRSKDEEKDLQKARERLSNGEKVGVTADVTLHL